ncbi:YfhO family protein [Leptospira ilyithenensis]|uniref:YfhO family protein n=1 Tax=Leptospira ilyithenensis TaxID=2484901 RepID=A0A4V3JXD9_9LEPT|nr:YfhO family protein [Leptospira ilyithenensis]TGN13732.1 hypothetical protein EHS11_03675 [Leptospira ilyithenensis]
MKYSMYYIMIGLTIGYLNFLFTEEWWNTSLGGFDWDQHFFYLESTRKPIVDFKEFPFWNPYYGGGVPVLENPQVKFLAPTNLFSFFFGTIIGLKFSILFYHLVGSLGCIYLFHNVLKFHPFPALFSSILFMFCGWHSQHVFPGHSQFFSTPILPFIIAFLIRFIKEQKPIYCFLSSFSAALLLFEGNIYIFLYTNLFLSLLSIYYLFSKETRSITFDIWKFLILTFLLSSYRLLPEMDYFFQYGAFYKADSLSLNVWNILDIFTNSSQHPFLAFPIPNQEYRWWEYGNYIGYLPLIVFFSLLGFTKKADFPFLILLILSLLLMLGDFHFLSPAHLLSQIPGFSNTRCYARWGIVFVFIFSILAGTYLNRLIDLLTSLQIFKKSNYFKLALPIFLCFLSIFLYTDVRKKNAKNFKGIFIYPDIIKSEKLKNFETYPTFPSYGADSSLLSGIFNNKSTRDSYENLLSNKNLPAVGDKNYQGEYYLINAGEIKQTHWSPGELHFHTNLPEKNILIINQNYNPQWKTRSQHTIKNINGLIGIELSKGENNIELYYISNYFRLGAFLGIIGLLYSFSGRFGYASGK